jgi:hypothetical protein
MPRALVLACLLLQVVAQPPRSTIITKPTTAPQRNVQVVYFDDAFLFLTRNFGDHRDPVALSEPGLFVQSRELGRWLQIVQISTLGGRFGRSWSDDPQAQRKLRAAPVGWDFSSAAALPYIDVPLRTSGTVAFPDRITYDAPGGTYELRFFSSFGVSSAETVVFIKRGDLVAEFAKR